MPTRNLCVVGLMVPLLFVPAAIGDDEPVGPTPKAADVQLEADLPAGFPAPGPADGVQLKHYPAYRVARAEGRGAFGQLFRHITKHDIAMTAPVEMTLDESGDETRPVDMMFMYPRPDMGAVGPDDTVKVMDLPPVTVFSLGRFGDGGDAVQAEALAEVHAAVDADPAWEPAGAARRFGYSSPFVPREQRYWEVQVPVRAVETDADGADAPGGGSAVE